jgi:hypothetical protein
MTSLFTPQRHPLEIVLATAGAVAIGAGAVALTFRVVDALRKPAMNSRRLVDAKKSKDVQEAMATMEGEGGSSKLSEAVI